MNQFCGPFFSPGADIFGMFVFIAVLLWLALPFLVFSLWLRAKRMEKALDQLLPLLQKQTRLLEQIASSQKAVTPEVKPDESQG